MSLMTTAVAALMATQTIMPDAYTMVCRSDEVTGINWRNGQWVQTNFVATQRIVVARPENECFDSNFNPAVRESFGVAFRDVCLNIREVGEAYEPLNSRVCTEMRMTQPTPNVQIQCYNAANSARFIVDGRYSYSSIAGVLTDPAPAGGRDSVFVEVGRCSLA